MRGNTGWQLFDRAIDHNQRVPPLARFFGLGRIGGRNCVERAHQRAQQSGQITIAIADQQHALVGRGRGFGEHARMDQRRGKETPIAQRYRAVDISGIARLRRDEVLAG